MIAVGRAIVARKVICVLTITNMATVRNTEFMSGKCNVAGISTTYFKLYIEVNY